MRWICSTAMNIIIILISPLEMSRMYRKFTPINLKIKIINRITIYIIIIKLPNDKLR